MKGVWWCIAGLALAASAAGQSGGELRFGLRADPKTLDPLLGAEEASETVAYLTSGVLIRLNRRTQELEPELATSWRVSGDGKGSTSNCGTESGFRTVRRSRPQT